jgi:hypothetical protein
MQTIRPYWRIAPTALLKYLLLVKFFCKTYGPNKQFRSEPSMMNMAKTASFCSENALFPAKLWYYQSAKLLEQWQKEKQPVPLNI